MTTTEARRVKLAGHEAEKEFADAIGGRIYHGSRKKDVVDVQGNIHSVKSGDKKWQIFLYGKKRFEESIGFLGARLFIECIDIFPEKRADYLKNKDKFKINLQTKMRTLKNFISGFNPGFIHSNKLIFLQEAIFHSSEVDYLSIKEGGSFHIFDAMEVIQTIDGATSVANSKAAQTGQLDDQKVIFKLAGKNTTIGEIEMRNDSDIHYREIKFWLDKNKTLSLLKDKIKAAKNKSERVVAYGKAVNRFKLNSRRAVD
ncbi:MAG: hypothetical protein NTW04_05665 [Elusimicrobia bacterium]|nr:hypothetical protein [Elusimicrobiota bacterium]